MASDRGDAFWLGIKIAEIVYGHSGEEAKAKVREIRHALSEVATGHLEAYDSPADECCIPPHITDPEAIRQFQTIAMNGHTKVLSQLNRDSMAVAKKLVEEFYKGSDHLD